MYATMFAGEEGKYNIRLAIIDDSVESVVNLMNVESPFKDIEFATNGIHHVLLE